MRLLFVCTGNTCRSLMAEGLASKIINRLNLVGKLEVASAGLAAFPGAPASSGARSVLSREGIDVSEHQAKQLTEDMLYNADVILTMTAVQKQHLTDLFPEVAEKIFILKEFAQGSSPDTEEESHDIPDPFGQPERVYQQCADELAQVIEQVLKRIADSG
ncbi:MAG TPA: low molecular weight protein arginine phosphatase [Syntrophomonadaceae bacterium]|nr:low molecular weight protein arginine phosphatase [Syntrophomonadaceae bacterium]